MTDRTTIGWSLITSGIVTVLLTVARFPRCTGGIGLLVLGVPGFVTRRTI